MLLVKTTFTKRSSEYGLVFPNDLKYRNNLIMDDISPEELRLYQQAAKQRELRRREKNHARYLRA